MSENVFVTTTGRGEESEEVVSLSSSCSGSSNCKRYPPHPVGPLPQVLHLSGLFQFNLKGKEKKGNAQAETPFTELKESKGSFDGYQ